MNNSPTSAPRPLWARLTRYLLIGAGAFLVLCGLAAFALPLVIEKVLLPRASESIGRQISVERIRFNPFKLTLTSTGIRVSDPEPGVDFVTVADIEADLSISSIRHLAPVVDALRIAAPVVSLYRLADGRFNFSDIVDRLQAEPEKPGSENGALQFALRNFELAAGELRIDDRLLKQTHRISDLHMAVPFISNLDDARTNPVQPVLSALVNGSPLSISGTTVPFTDSRETSLDVNLRELDIATYLPLSPVTYPVTVEKGKLSTDLKVDFAQEGDNRKLVIGGSTQVDGLQVQYREGGKLVFASLIRLGLDRIEPLVRSFAFGELVLGGVDVELQRLADGSFPIARALTASETSRASPAAAPSPGAAPDPSPGAGNDGVRWSIRRTTLAGARVAYSDRSVSPAVQLVHTDLDLELAEIGNRQAQAAAGKLSLKQNESSQLSWAGEIDLSKSRAAGRLNAGIASLAPYRPYLAGAVKAGLESGAIAAEGDVKLGWAEGLTLELVDAQASVQGAKLTLPDDPKPAIALERLAAQGVALSLTKRRVDVARVEIAGADVDVERDAAGRLNLQRLVSRSDAETAAGDPPRAEETASAGERKAPAAWGVKVARVDLAGNRFAWRDLSAPQPVSVAVSDLRGAIEQVGSDLSTTSRVDLQARVGDTGTLTARGSMVVEPLTLQLAVQVRQLALAAFDPYLSEKLALGIDEGALGTTGELEFAKDRVRYRGRLELDGLRSRERTTSAQAIRWKKLLLEDIDVDVEPAVLGPADRIAVGAITLNEFFARVVLSEQGRFNLQDIVVTEASTQALARADQQAAERAASKDGGGNRSSGSAGGTTQQAPEADEGTPPPSGAQPPARRAAASSPPLLLAKADGPTIRVGRIKLERGSSNFTDRFVQPNYSVNLTELEGGLSALASDDPKPADLALTGRVDGNAPIDITGKINPFGPTLYTDIHAVAKGIDLPTLSPYSLKYAGYAIEKGKLSLDVHYTIENEQLQADNNLFLDQLTLGEKVESPGATSLPIQFALGLLKNGKGEINVTLPISGSLNDPQFSIGGVIGRAIVNLLTRVVTAPFSALASAFGGGGGGAEELSFVEFRPGTSALTDESVKRLQALSKALIERPALKLEIAGRVDPKAERDEIERQRLDARLKALKRRRAGGADAPATQEREEAGTGQETAASPQPNARGAKEQQDRATQTRQAQANQEEAAVAAGVTISKDEYPVLLRLLYEESGLAGNARNAGSNPGSNTAPNAASNAASKTPPNAPASAAGNAAAQPNQTPAPGTSATAPSPDLAEMEKQLLDAIAVDTETTRRLATRRSQVVRRWLATQGKIQEDRMFMLAPRLSPEAMGPNQSKPQCPASCAEFSLR